MSEPRDVSLDAEGIFRSDPPRRRRAESDTSVLSNTIDVDAIVDMDAFQDITTITLHKSFRYLRLILCQELHFQSIAMCKKRVFQVGGQSAAANVSSRSTMIGV